MDVATALAGFLSAKATDDMIMGMQVKLESSLQKLQRFGYSIDRLRIDPTAPIDGESVFINTIHNDLYFSFTCATNPTINNRFGE
jgi:hypothetical protein